MASWRGVELLLSSVLSSGLGRASSASSLWEDMTQDSSVCCLRLMTTFHSTDWETPGFFLVVADFSVFLLPWCLCKFILIKFSFPYSMPQFLWVYVRMYIYMYILKSGRAILEIKGKKLGSNKLEREFKQKAVTHYC